MIGETSDDDDDEGDPSLNIEKMLDTPEGRREARRYFPVSYTHLVIKALEES